MTIKTYILFDLTTGEPLFHVDMNTEIPDFEYTRDDIWALLEQHPSSTMIKGRMTSPVKAGSFFYKVDRSDTDYKTSGTLAFVYNPTSHLVEKATLPERESQ